MLCYKLKKILFLPYVLIQRRWNRNLEHHMKMVLEVFNYSPNIFKFLRNKTLLYEHTLDHNSVVMDVGGFSGEWAKEINSRYHSNLHVFEPNPTMLTGLNKAFSNAPNIRVHDYGLSDRDSASMLLLRGPGSSVYKHPKVEIENHKAVEINLRDIKRVLDELDVGEIDMIKINIEGGEYPLLYRMIEENLLKRCKQLMIQFHEWYPWARWHRWKIARKLRNTHKRVWCYPFIWEKWVRREIASE